MILVCLGVGVLGADRHYGVMIELTCVRSAVSDAYENERVVVRIRSSEYGFIQ